MNIGNNIRSLRKNRGLSQSRLAELAGTTQQHISLIEKDVSGIELGTLNRILAALGREVSFQERGWTEPERITARLDQWERFSELEQGLSLERTPGQRLTDIGGLVDFYRTRHKSAVEGEEILVRHGEAMRAWRSRLGRIAVSG